MSDGWHDPGQETKVCGFCSEDIKKQALVCPYCREKLGWYRLAHSGPQIFAWICVMMLCLMLATCGSCLSGG